MVEVTTRLVEAGAPTTMAATAMEEQVPHHPLQLPKPIQSHQIQVISLALTTGTLISQIQAAKEIRKLVRSSPSPASAAKTRSRLVAAGVVQPLVSMLGCGSVEAREVGLVAVLNLAARNERNKVSIVASGAIPPLVEILKSQTSKLPELATAAILSLSTAPSNKLIIANSGAPPLLVHILENGTMQGKVDAVTALYYLSTGTESSSSTVNATAVSSLISLLRECKKYSKFAEKATALLEILSDSEEGRIAISDFNDGILTLVETVEDGSLVSTEHAVGVLLSLCRSCRSKYRDLILKEGAIPGLLRLTVEGTDVARERATMLLDLLRDSTPQKRLASSILEEIAYDIALRVCPPDKASETAKRLLLDMVRTSMELRMNRIQLQE
ncbi:U-box domain-containing protein [Drosera capensis]